MKNTLETILVLSIWLSVCLFIITFLGILSAEPEDDMRGVIVIAIFNIIYFFVANVALNKFFK